MSLNIQHRYRNRLLKRIADRCAIGGSSEIGAAQTAREIERYLSSHWVQNAVRHEIWSRKYGSDEAIARWRASQVAPIVPYNYRRLRDAPIVYHHKPRTTSGLRKICSIPDTTKMWHTITRDLVVAQHQPRQHIGDWRGRGREFQIDQIRAALRSPHQAVVSADVIQAFASVNIDTVYELPYLPEPLVRRAIDYRSHRFIRRERSEYARDVTQHIRHLHDPHHVGALENSPSGLMEGSPASNAIFSVLLDDLPDHMEEGIQTFVYCDNIILLAPTMSRALRAREALVRYLAGHRAGPFEMRSSVAHVRDGFEHLGYTLRCLPGAQPDVGIGLNGWLKLVDRLFSEPRDVDETVKWLKASYGRCDYSNLEDFFRLAGSVGR